MRIIKYLLIVSVLLSFTAGGCGLFKKKTPFDNMSNEEMLQEQQKMRRQIDSLKKVQLDKDIDSLRIKLDSQSIQLKKTQEDMKKSEEEFNKKMNKK